MAISTDDWIYEDLNKELVTTDEITPAVNDTTKSDAARPEETSSKGDKEAEKLGNVADDKPKALVAPKAALSDNLDRRANAFAAQRHKYEQKLARAERERDTIRKELEDLKKEHAESKSFIEQALLAREIKQKERSLASVAAPEAFDDEANNLAIADASEYLDDAHLNEYKTRIVPYRANLYSQLSQIGGKLGEVLLDGNAFTPAIELALASDAANDVLQHLNTNSYRETYRRCETYANKLFPRKDTAPKAPEQTKAPTVTPKVNTPSVTPTETTVTKTSEPSIGEIAAWF